MFHGTKQELVFCFNITETISCKFCGLTKTLEFNLIYCELDWLVKWQSRKIDDRLIPVTDRDYEHLERQGS